VAEPSRRLSFTYTQPILADWTRSARAQGLRVVPLSPVIAIPVVASVAINGERSALFEQFVKTCQETMRLLR
jgi:hypothetical protein